MSFLPSISYLTDVVRQEAPSLSEEEIIRVARNVLSAIAGWQDQQHVTPSRRYGCEAADNGWVIFDKNVGRATILGTIHDPLLTQQIVDELNSLEDRKVKPVATRESDK